MIRVVPHRQQTATEALVQKLKNRVPQAENELRCPVCGSRTTAKVVNGKRKSADSGRTIGGETLFEALCFDCLGDNHRVEMVVGKVVPAKLVRKVSLIHK